MKHIYYIWLLGAIVSACSSNEYKLYSGQACIQFEEGKDTVQRYTFYFQPSATTVDTLWFDVITTGYASDVPRSFTIVQNQLEGVDNAVAGVHYKKFEEMDYVVQPNAVTARVPVVLYKAGLADRTTYHIEMQICDSEDFYAGIKTRLKSSIVFSKDLLKPNGWSGYLETNILGPYSISKHEWMIQQTGQKWDEEFLESLDQDPGVNIYWRDKLNALLAEYIRNGGVLLDDNKQPVNGFPE